MTDEIRLLHVDDDTEFRELTAEFLNREEDRFDIVTAATAAEGLDRVEDDDIDCVVSDYKLEGMDGIEFLDEIRLTKPDIPFIIFTGKGSESVASEAISAGATDYFRKDSLVDEYDHLANRIMNAVSANRARQRVRRRTRQYRTLIDQAPVPMLVICTDHELEYVNQATVEALGAEDKDDVIGIPAGDLLPEDGKSFGIGRLEHVISEREAVEITEYAFLDLDGNRRFGRGTIVPITFDGEPAAQIVISDITERKRHKDRLRRRQAQITRLHEIGVKLAGCENREEVYELMIDAAEGILDIDLCVVDSVDGEQLVVEAMSSELTEYTESPLDEGGLAAKAYRTGDSFLVDDISECQDADPVGEYRSIITVPIGEFGVFQAAARETGSFDEGDLELLEILREHVSEALTRLEQQEQLREQRDKLQRENERLDQFASIVSHDIRNPLNVAQLRLDLAMEESDSENLAAVARSVERIETLTDELLSLARMGKDTIELEPISLGTVVEGCWENVDTGDASLSVTTDTVIEADSARLQQLLENLFRNSVEHGSTSNRPEADDSVEHGGDGVDVTVGLIRDEDGFYVADDGVGMSAEIQQQAFDSGFSTQENGTGFGLAIVARAAETHGWEVEVTESAEGGARFEFRDVSVLR